MLEWQVTRRRIMLQELSYSSLILITNLSYLRQWLLRWNCEIENKLISIEPRVSVINMFRLPHQDVFKISNITSLVFVVCILFVFFQYINMYINPIC